MIKKLTSPQFEIFNDKHRFKIICAGRRFGKSVLARTMILDWALKKPDGVFWIVNPNYRQAKEIHWQELQKEIPKTWVLKKNETELSITLRNGSVISLKGAENPDTLKGRFLNGLCVDEIASIREWEWLWDESLRAMLTDYEAPAVFISTPKGYNHFYELYMRGQQDDPLYKSWKYTSYDNKHVKPEEINSAKKEISEEKFAQEYLAEFTLHTGLAHKIFKRSIHVIEPFEVPQEWVRGRGLDYGTTHFTASVRIAVMPDGKDDMWFLERCYMDHHRTIESHSLAIQAEDYGLKVRGIFGDPSGPQWLMEFVDNGLFVQSANKKMGQGSRGWVEFCVEKINERLKPIPGHTVKLPDGRVIDNCPRLLILNNTSNILFIKQIEKLSWRETATGELIPILDETGDPTGGHFDIMSAMRYFTVSYMKTAPPSNGLPFDSDHRTWGVSDISAYQ